jgi:hypothetical protein
LRSRLARQRRNRSSLRKQGLNHGNKKPPLAETRGGSSADSASPTSTSVVGRAAVRRRQVSLP